MGESEKLLIVLDAEGCRFFEGTNADGGKSAMEKEAASVLSALKEDGYVLSIVDAHSNGHNIDDLAKEFKGVRFINHLWGLKDFDYDKAVVLGMHAKEGAHGRFAHTLRTEIAEVLIEDESVGEATLITNWLAYYSIPVVFIAGAAGMEEEVDKLGIHYYIHTENEQSLETMNHELRKALRRELKLFAYNKGKISIRFQEPLFLDFIHPFIGRKGEKKLELSNTKYMMDIFPCISILIEAAHSFRNMVFQSVRVKVKQDYEALITTPERFNELLDKRFVSLDAEELHFLLEVSDREH